MKHLFDKINLMKRRQFIQFQVILLSLFFSLNCFAANKAYYVGSKLLQNINVSYTGQWSDISGRRFSVISDEYGWGLKNAALADGTRTEIPSFRIKVSLSNFPKNHKFDSITSISGSKLINYDENQNTIDFSIESRITEATVQFKDTKTNKLVDYKIKLEILADQSLLIIDEDCTKDYISPKSTVSSILKSEYFYIGINCSLKNLNQLLFFKSHDAKWNESSQVGKLDHLNNNEFIVYPLSKSLEDYESQEVITNIGAYDIKGTIHNYDLLINPPPREKRSTLNLGFNFSIYKYNENSLELTMIKKSLAGQLDYKYIFTPNKYSLYISTFSDLYTFNYFPRIFTKYNTEINPFSYYGLNPKFGYQLPFEFLDIKFIIQPGVTLLGMFVNPPTPQGIYGIRTWQGPQLGLLLSKTPPGHRGVWTYGRYSALSTGMQFNSSRNHEITAGLGFQLFMITDNPFAFVFEVTRIQYSEPKGDIDLSKFSFGISQPIW